MVFIPKQNVKFHPQSNNIGGHVAHGKMRAQRNNVFRTQGRNVQI